MEDKTVHVLEALAIEHFQYERHVEQAFQGLEIDELVAIVAHCEGRSGRYYLQVRELAMAEISRRWHEANRIEIEEARGGSIPGYCFAHACASDQCDCSNHVN